MRITLADAKASRIPAAIGICATEQRFIDIINEAQERLLTKGLWWDCFGKFRICTSNGCITLPPQISTIESAAVCGTPVQVRDEWFEFLENGYGPRGSCTTSDNCGGGIGESLKRGYACTFKDIIPTGKKLNVVCDLASDVGKTVLLLGYDDNGNWIRTNQSGTIKDGELVAFAQSGGTNSISNFSSINDIQLPANMNGQSWLYEYDVVATTRRLIGK